MDALTATLMAIAAIAILTALALWSRNRKHAAAVDDAIARIGGSPPNRRYQRSRALDEALQRLERSTATAQKERSRLAGAIQSAPIGMLVTDDGGSVLVSNPAADRFLGTSPGEPVAQARVREAIEQAMLARTAVDVDVELFTPTRAVLEVAAVPLDFGVESVGSVAFIVDVTEHKRVAVMRRDFVANVNHELKAPLAALAALAESLAEAVDPAAGAIAVRLRTEADRLAVLVGDILELSQAEALTGHDEPVAIGQVVSAVVDDVRATAETAGIELSVTPIPQDARVAGDGRQLRTMLSNLVANAIQYGDGGEVTIVVTTTADTVTIAIEDRGIGIAAETLDRVFERFYRVDRTAGEGAGLGLSVARHIARNHRGEITVESTEGKGSTFTATLPRWTAP